MTTTDRHRSRPRALLHNLHMLLMYQNRSDDKPAIWKSDHRHNNNICEILVIYECSGSMFPIAHHKPNTPSASGTSSTKSDQLGEFFVSLGQNSVHFNQPHLFDNNGRFSFCSNHKFVAHFSYLPLQASPLYATNISNYYSPGA